MGIVAALTPTVVSMTFVNAELIQEELSPLVWVRHFHAGDKADWGTMRVGNQHVVIRIVQKLAHGFRLRQGIEEVTRLDHALFIAWSHPLDV